MQHGNIGDGPGVGDAAGFHQYMFGGIGPSHQIHHGQQQIIAHGATNAAIGQCHRIAAVSGQQIAIHRQIAKIVDHHGKAQARVLSKQIIQQGGLAGAEETTNDRQRNGHGYPANRRPGQETHGRPKPCPRPAHRAGFRAPPPSDHPPGPQSRPACRPRYCRPPYPSSYYRRRRW